MAAAGAALTEWPLVLGFEWVTSDVCDISMTDNRSVRVWMAQHSYRTLRCGTGMRS